MMQLQTTPTAAPQNIPTAELYYAATVTLDKLNLRNVPADFRVIPGMPVETDIRVGTQTIMQYLMERIVPVFTQGMNEPS